MTNSTLFIADLHLSDQQPEIYKRFITFIETKARHARALYILGDLFEYYLGDDAVSGVIQQVREDLNKLVTNYQVECYFMHGNRDFLLADTFANIKLLRESCVIKLDNNKVILTHGDALCTDDIEYQKIRQLLRSTSWQKDFLAKSIPERIEFAQKARQQSRQHTNSSPDEIMDVNSHAVMKLFRTHESRMMIHGHTHRPAFHNHTRGDKKYQRMVLGDWHYQTSYIEYKNNNFQLVTC